MTEDATDNLAELLGIDYTDPLNRLARDLTHADHLLLADLVLIRKGAALSQAEVAQRMGTTPAAVVALERMDSDPRLSTLRRYALAVGVTVKHHVGTP